MTNQQDSDQDTQQEPHAAPAHTPANESQPVSDPEADSALREEARAAVGDDSLKLEETPSKQRAPKLLAIAGLAGGVLALIITRSGASTQTAEAQLQPEPVPENSVSRAEPVPEWIAEAPDRPAARAERAAPKAEQVDSDPLPRLSEGLAATEPVGLQQPSAEQQAELMRAERAAQQDARALEGDMFFGSKAPDSAQRPSGLPEPSVLPSAAALPAAPQPSPDPNGQQRKAAFLNTPSRGDNYLGSSLEGPRSPYEIKAGDVIGAAFVTALNSDLPGPIVAQVTSPVYDTATKQHLLISPGARLIGRYDSMIAWGQERVLMCWDRLIFPKGESIDLECMPAADRIGQSGITGDVDEHWTRVIQAAGMSTVLSLGTQAVAGRASFLEAPSVFQTAAANGANQVNAAGQAIVSRGLQIQPTITVPPGSPVNVIVTKDVILRAR